MNDLETLQYPVGRFARPVNVDRQDISTAIETIADFPGKMENAVDRLNDSQLDTPYRQGGWTIRQVVHHCADSHMNAYIRFKLALTEDTPTIKPYDQARWAELPDSLLDPEVSLNLIKGAHQRWITILEAMTDAEWERRLIHPEQPGEQTLKQMVMMYAWHCDHHLAHITGLVTRKGWQKMNAEQ